MGFSFKGFLYKLLNSSTVSRRLLAKVRNAIFPGSKNYWEKRYKLKGNSGNGSYGKNAEYKATIINDFITKHSVINVLEYGCGDGNQLKYFGFQNYIGLDVSPSAISRCKEIYKDDETKFFYLYPSARLTRILENFKADLSLSLDVIFHLVEDKIFEKYMFDLFHTTSAYVIIYSWDVDGEKKLHVRQRNFSKWIAQNIPNFHLIKHIKADTINSYCDFFMYEINNK